MLQVRTIRPPPLHHRRRTHPLRAPPPAAQDAPATPSIENRKAGGAKIENKISLPQFFAQEKPEGCPYQIDNLCTAREARPLGCRLYFCDENAQSWQNELYEKYHARLREVHERLHLPYRYLEWRATLRELA